MKHMGIFTYPFVLFCGYTTRSKEDDHGKQFKVYDHLSLLRSNDDR
jgi:hypothetical protein